MDEEQIFCIEAAGGVVSVSRQVAVEGADGNYDHMESVNVELTADVPEAAFVQDSNADVWAQRCLGTPVAQSEVQVSKTECWHERI